METAEPIRGLVFDASTVVLGSGIIGVIGWLTLLILVVLAGIAVVRLLTNRQSPLAGMFFGCAHVQGLMFLLCIRVCGILSYFQRCCGGLPELLLYLGQLLLSLGMGLGINLACVSIVALTARRRPRIRFVDGVNILWVSIDILFLLAIVMILVVHAQ